MNKNTLLKTNLSKTDQFRIRTCALFHRYTKKNKELTRWWWWWWWCCLFFWIGHWRGGVIIVWIRIITTFNLPRRRWWRWRTVNINYWCPWRSHNLKVKWKEYESEKKRKNQNEHYFSLFLFSLSLSLSLSLFRSLSPSLSLLFMYEYWLCVCVHHLWLKKDRWISAYLVLDFSFSAHVMLSNEDEEIRQLLFLLECEWRDRYWYRWGWWLHQNTMRMRKTSFVLQIIIRQRDESRLITQSWQLNSINLYHQYWLSGSDQIARIASRLFVFHFLIILSHR